MKYSNGRLFPAKITVTEGRPLLEDCTSANIMRKIETKGMAKLNHLTRINDVNDSDRLMRCEDMVSTQFQEPPDKVVMDPGG